MLWLLAGLACEDRLGFDAVSLYPTFGYTDGCTNVRMGGHGFTDDFSATIGGNPVTDIEDPAPGESHWTDLDQGFMKTGVTPAGEQGFADYKATDSGESATVTNAFYYLACPGAPYIESVAATDGTITISGCGFDSGSTTVYLVPKGGDFTKDALGPFDVSQGCLTASITVSPGAGAPPGVYDLYISLDGGQTFIPDPACVEDTADTATTCPPPPVVSIKGGA
jgi:hypothetical protein